MNTFFDANILSDNNQITNDFSETRALANVVSLQTVPSTNTVAQQLIAQGDWNHDGITVIAAREQTAGRGRLDHTWFSEADESFTVSFISGVGTEVAHNPSLNGWLQMIAGLAVVDALRETLNETNLNWVADSAKTTQSDGAKNDVMLKWPNDIVFRGHKLGGILAQMVSLPDPDTVAVIFGVGLNINVPEHQLPTDEATSWQLITQPNHAGSRPTTARTTDLIAAHTVTHLKQRLWQFGLDPQEYAQDLHKRFKEECWTLDRPVAVHYVDGSTLWGRARSVNGDASIVVMDINGKEHIVHTADVGVLPTEKE